MKLPTAAAAAVLALGALLSSPPANAAAVRTSSATTTATTTTTINSAPRRRHLQQATPADDVPPPRAQLARVCATDSFACPGTFFEVLRNPAQGCEFYPCPPPPGAAAVDNDEASPKVTSTDSQDGNDQLLADMATLGALANVEEDAPKGGGGPQDAADDVDVLAVQGDGSDLPTALPVPPVVIAEEEDAGMPVDGASPTSSGLADELAAFDDALLTSPTPPTSTIAADCTPCTNVPTANMLKRRYDCTTAIQALAVQCHEDDGWTASHICEYSCYKAGRGYARTDVLQGGTRCCEVGEVPQAEQAEEVVGEEVVEEVVEEEEVATPTVVATPEVDVGGVDPAEVAREEEDDDGEGDEEPATGETVPAEESTGAATTTEEAGDETAADPDVVEATEEEEEEEESTAMEEATEEEMVEAGDAPPQSPAEAGAAAGDTTATDVDVEAGAEDEDEDEGEGEAKPEMEVEIISESIAVVDTAPATTTDEEDEEEEEEDAEEAATTDIGATDQDGGAVDETLLEGDDEEPATVTAEEAATDQDEQVESATTPPLEEATTVTTEEVISEDEDTDEDMDQDMDQADTAEDIEETTEDEASSPASTTEEESTTIEMTTTASVAKENFDKTTEPMCGVDAGDALCPSAEDGTAVYCCSKWGFCGQGVEWCGDGCQEGYGLCDSGETTEAEADTEPGTDMAGDANDESTMDEMMLTNTTEPSDLAGDIDEEYTTMDEMAPSNTTEPSGTDESANEDVEGEVTGTAEEVTDEVIMPEEPADDMEDPTDAVEETTDAMEEPITEETIDAIDEPIAEEPPMDETSDIEDTEGDMDEAATTATPEDPIAEIEDLIPGDAVTEISREGVANTTETSMDEPNQSDGEDADEDTDEDDQGSGLRGGSVAAVQTATSSSAGVKIMASIVIAGASTVVFGMM